MDMQQKYGLIRSMFEGSQVEPIEALRYLKGKTNYVDLSDMAAHFNLSLSGADRLVNIAAGHGFCKRYGNRLCDITQKGTDFVDNADVFLSTIE